MLATCLGEIPIGHNSEFDRKRLEEHRNDVGSEDNPEERITVLRARLKVRGKVAWIHVGD